MAGKQRRAPFPQAAKGRAQGLLDLVHGDLCGPIEPAMAGGKRYFLLLVDDMSRYMWLSVLRSKDEAAGAIARFQARVETETGRRLRALQTDRGSEFTSSTSATTVQTEGCSGSSRRRTPLSKTALWSAVTRRWWPWPGA